MPLDTYVQRLSSLLLIIGLADTAQAQDECQLNLSETVVDFGQMNRLTQNDSAAQRLLGEHHLSLTLNCPQPQDLSLFYNALAASNQRLQFTEHGSYQIHVSDGVLDGQAVELGLLPGSGQALVANGATLNWRAGHGIAPSHGNTVLSGKHFSLQLVVSAWADAAATHVREATTWEVTGLFDARRSGRSRELTLRARFAPIACTPRLSNGGIVDYGTLLAKDLKVKSATALPTKTLQFSVNCDGAARFALLMHDNRSGSASGDIDDTAYGLGLDSSRNKIGRYYLGFDPADFSADSVPRLYRTDSPHSGTAWSSASSQLIALAAHSYMGFTDTSASTSGPMALQNLSGTVHINAYLAPAHSLDLRDTVQINGSGTLEIIYL